MATLHFDTDAGKNASTTIQTGCDSLNDQLNALNSRVNSLVGSEWMGNSANQFKGEFDSWATQLRACTDNLATLKTRLDTEIAEWEAAAQGLA